MQALSKTAYNCALEMLARREHSYWELTKKLAQQYQADDIEQALSKLQSQNYQSDQRFANEFIQMRFNQGKGPIKIATDRNFFSAFLSKTGVLTWLVCILPRAQHES
jgi:regulatory protein